MVGACVPSYQVVSELSATGGSITACEAALAEAAFRRVETGDEHDVDRAIRICSSVGQFVAAASKDDDALHGIDPRAVAENRCPTSKFDDTAICRELRLP